MTGRFIPLAVGTSIAGYLSVVAPWWRAVLVGSSNASNPIDGFQPVSLLLLCLVGVVFGLITPGRCWIGGLLSVSLFPVLAIWDTVQDPTSHNLLPFEFLVYGGLAVPGVFGGLVGRLITRVARLMQHERDDTRTRSVHGDER